VCGISGCFGKRDEVTINKMLDALTKRGPDDRGVYAYGDMVLGHTRLSIVDVKKGHQPILAKAGRAGVICNGEIYNFMSLRNQIGPGASFKTGSDSEVVLHMYLKEGPDFVKKLDGMFAFVVFDGDDFMLARDPVGIKPLYYGYSKGAMYVSSELGAMSLADVSEVYEFPAGHYYTPKEGFKRYYSTPPVHDFILTEVEEASSLIRQTFKAAVKKRLLADKEIAVGSFCSGGLDSSLVAAIAAEEIPHLHTFAVGMKDKDGNESDDLPASRVAARHIGSTHHELIFSEDDYYRALPGVIHVL